MKLKGGLILLAGLAIGVGLGIPFIYDGVIVDFSSQQENKSGDGTLVALPVEGLTAPDFELEAITGERVRLSYYHGNPVLINFWATWCYPCRLEMPHIQSRFEQYRPDLVVLAVNFDEPIEDVEPFVDELRLTFEVLLDPGGEVQNLFRVRGYPTSFFVDADGVVRVLHIGFMTEEQLDGYLAQVGVDE